MLGDFVFCSLHFQSYFLPNIVLILFLIRLLTLTALQSALFDTELTDTASSTNILTEDHRSRHLNIKIETGDSRGPEDRLLLSSPVL